MQSGGVVEAAADCAGEDRWGVREGGVGAGGGGVGG